MALPHRVVKVTLSGTMFGGAEIWSTGFHMGYENSDAAAITDQGIADVAEAWATFFSNQTTGISNRYSFTMCKMAMLGVDGKSLPDSAHYYSPQTAVTGGGGPTVLPPQLALVATLANSLPRGLATKGRMFLPGINFGIDDSGHLPSFYTDQVALNLKAFFDSVYQDADLPGNPVLASTGNSLQLRPGAIRNVTQIRIGNVYDTQRRRRNALTETYKTLPVSVG